ncbi:hypothetical protein Bhyg_13680 [Pseudolycoriella hygida]|uniref:Uncharacterized protein n=1 Tax=Pseudolycoriella hygida TaxID=35572 RepID=A0A9Q0RWK6_9DIPT|nr:hypothetical protein Bhyg_13680 [Pseudolycoriella hygida]
MLTHRLTLFCCCHYGHKRKVQNFFPCKTQPRGHIDTTISGGHSVTYEDPDAHMGRRPLVMRHHNMEMLHSKSLHYPSGYPMTRSPPLFVCSSPGPDPYRSHDNVYEELGPARDSDGESDIALHSDDDFAEDESSLPGERSLNKLSSHDVAPTVATIYHERVAAGGGGGGAAVNVNGGCCLIERSGNERNSLLSSSSSDRNGCGSSSGYGNDKGGNSTVRNSTSPDSGLFRGGRRLFNHRSKQRTYSTDELNTSSEQTPSDVVPTIYDERNLLTLPYSHNNSNNSFNNHSSSHRNKSINCCNSTLANDEVERRNHLNNQLSAGNTVSTIYRGRTMVNGRNPPSINYHNSHSSRSRTNPRSLDRRRINTTLPSPNNETSYVYPEPMFHDGMVYDSCLSHQINDRNHLYPYILPEFTSFRNMTSTLSEQPNQPIHPIYSRDSSFGSDSGYSHHTQTSGRGGGGSGSGANSMNHGGGALSSLWGRNKENATRKAQGKYENLTSLFTKSKTIKYK